jgi:hypothetical protein
MAFAAIAVSTAAAAYGTVVALPPLPLGAEVRPHPEYKDFGCLQRAGQVGDGFSGVQLVGIHLLYCRRL